MACLAPTSASEKRLAIFQQELEESNRAKNADAPLALVIHPRELDSNFFPGHLNLWNILTIGKTHRVVYQRLREASSLHDTLRETVRFFRKKLSLLVFDTHGNATSISLGNTTYGKRKIDPSVYAETMDEDSTILTFGCQNGKELAKDLLAASPQSTIIATSENVYLNTTHVYFCNLHKRIESASFMGKKQQMQVMNKESFKEPCMKEFRDHRNFRNYLLKKAQQGDGEAQYTLGCCYHLGIKGFPVNKLAALPWLMRSADQGCSEPLYFLGEFHKHGYAYLSPSDSEALRWYLQGAKKNDPDCLCEIGLFYSEGRGGLKRDDRAALWYFNQAWSQKHFASLYYLGLFHEQGRGGLDKSDENALQCYQLGARAGDSQCLLTMGIFNETGRGGLHPDEDAALSYYERSVEIGNEDARIRLNRLRKRMREKEAVYNELAVPLLTN